jgi:hypothetical protein
VRRRLTWFLTGGVGAGVIVYRLRRRSTAPPASDPAEELRQRLAEARAVERDRDEFEAGELPVDAVESEPSLDERRREVHAQGRAVVDEMRGPADPQG